MVAFHRLGCPERLEGKHSFYRPRWTWPVLNATRVQGLLRSEITETTGMAIQPSQEPDKRICESDDPPLPRPSFDGRGWLLPSSPIGFPGWCVEHVSHPDQGPLIERRGEAHNWRRWGRHRDPHERPPDSFSRLCSVPESTMKKGAPVSRGPFISSGVRLRSRPCRPCLPCQDRHPSEPWARGSRRSRLRWSASCWPRRRRSGARSW